MGKRAELISYCRDCKRSHVPGPCPRKPKEPEDERPAAQLEEAQGTAPSIIVPSRKAKRGKGKKADLAKPRKRWPAGDAGDRGATASGPQTVSVLKVEPHESGGVKYGENVVIQEFPKVSDAETILEGMRRRNRERVAAHKAGMPVKEYREGQKT